MLAAVFARLMAISGTGNVQLGNGDSILVMGVQGLPRLTGDQHHYADEEVASATFEFVIYTVSQ